MKRRICIFAAQYFPHLGGVERYTYNLAKKLIDMGNDVTVVTSNVQKISTYEKMDGIPVYRMPCINLLDGRYPVSLFNKKFVKIHHMLRNKHFDLIIVNTRFYIHSLYGQWFAWSKHMKVITIDHGSSHLSVNNKMWDRIGGAFEHFITKVGQLFCKDYYGVSQASVNWLKHFHIKARGILYNSVNLEEIERILRECQKKYRKEYGIGRDDIVITYTGRLLPEKGVPQLVSAVNKISETDKKVYLLIAGEGDLEKYVEENKTEHIIPLGKLSHEEVITLLSETDIFCLPSVSEGFSTSILEAIACRCYVVTTERGGAKETFPTDEYGMVIKDNDVQLLITSLSEAIKEEGMRRHAVGLVYNRLKKNYTWDIVTNKVNDIAQEG